MHATRARQQNAAVALKASAASMESICLESDCGKMVWDDFHAATPLTRSPGDPQRNTQEGGEVGVVFHVHGGPMLRALIVAHLLSELISELTTKWRNDTKYATSPGCNS